MASGGPATGTVRSPYQGLMPYREEDADFFFGRDAERDIIIANLLAARLTLLYGASGVGKSSVLRAGVAHKLRGLSERNLKATGSVEHLVVAFNAWRDDPVSGLKQCIVESVQRTVGQPASDVPMTLGLTDFIKAWNTKLDCDLLIILDQFEEYFLYHPSEVDPASLAFALPAVLCDDAVRANFLISIRDDSLSKLDAFKGRIPRLFENFLRIDHLDWEAAGQAIRRPVEKFNLLCPDPGSRVEIQDALVDDVRNQVKAGRVTLSGPARGAGSVAVSEHGALIETPFLQLVMERLWKEESAARPMRLRQATLHALGGADKIVRSHLVTIMSRLSGEEQEVAARAFYHLVTPSGGKIAHTVEDLASFAERPQGVVAKFVEQLTRSDSLILRAVPAPIDEPNVQRFEIFHDVLGAAILDWRASYERARASERAIATERLRARKLNRLISNGVVLFVLGLGVVVWQQQKQSDTTRASAIATSAIANLRSDPKLSLRLAIEAADVHVNQFTDSALKLWFASPSRGVYPTASALSPGGRYIREVISSPADTVFGWEALTGRLVRLPPQLDDAIVENLVLSPNDSLTVALVVDTLAGLTRIEVLETETWRPVQTIVREKLAATKRNNFPGTNSPMETRQTEATAAFSGNGQWLVVTRNDGLMTVWRTSDWTVAQTFSRLIFAYGTRFNGDGSLFLTISRNRMVATSKIWRTSDWTNVSGFVTPQGPEGNPYTISQKFSRDLRFAAIGPKGSLRLWDILQSRPISALDAIAKEALLVGFSPNGEWVALAEPDAHRVYRTSDWSQILEAGWSGLWFSNDGSRVVSHEHVSDSIAVVTLQDTRQPEWAVVATLGDSSSAEPCELSNVHFSPKDQVFATVCESGLIRVWESATGRLLAALTGHQSSVENLRFSADERTVISLDAAREARVWDLRGNPCAKCATPAARLSMARSMADRAARPLTAEERRDYLGAKPD